MPRMVIRNGSANALTYALGQAQALVVEAISADVNTTAVAPGTASYCDAIYRDQAGFLIARSRSSVTLADGGIVTMTFAPWLPDTNELGNAFVGYVNTTGLCATTLPPGATVTVQVSEAAAFITQIRLWVEDAEDAGGSFDDEDAAHRRFMLVPGPGA